MSDQDGCLGCIVLVIGGLVGLAWFPSAVMCLFSWESWCHLVWLPVYLLIFGFFLAIINAGSR
jgi:hypothetical protein